MTVYEIVTILLILLGLLIVIISFYIKDKNSSENTLYSNEHYEEFGARIEELNNKILQVNEYSEFIKAELEDKHKELLFLYQMINEKSKQINSIDSNIDNSDDSAKDYEELSNKIEPKKNNNKLILELSNKGYTVKEISRMLDIAQGEVKLVLDLYK